MKPGSRDVKYKIMITGQELEKLKKFTGDMAESFGLDRRIENYHGKRPIDLYRWDLDCLEPVIRMTLDDKQEYPDKSGDAYKAMKQLYDRIRGIHKEAYKDEQ